MHMVTNTASTSGFASELKVRMEVQNAFWSLLVPPLPEPSKRLTSLKQKRLVQSLGRSEDAILFKLLTMRMLSDAANSADCGSELQSVLLLWA